MDNYLILSAHDYRTPRRASMHFLADEIAKRGRLRFFSLRYSRLSAQKGDMRLPLDAKANRIEQVNGVDCFLWKTPVHPFNTRRPWLRPAEDLAYRLYAAKAPRVLRDWIAEADVIIIESGTAIAFFDLVKRINPTARVIYRASDDLGTINVAGHIHQTFARIAPKFDAICMLSPRIGDKIASKANQYYVPNGVDPGIDAMGDPSPYPAEGIHAVSIGSMLFDASFFEYAGRAFPQVTFHVIGSGQGRQPGYGDNVIAYPDMPYAETIRYIKHAAFGIAPYVSEDVPAYLADSSLKVLQYDYFALPTVCPNSVVGAYASRFGYRPGDNAGIDRAIRAALAAPHERTRPCFTWGEVTARLLDPAAFPDTSMAGR